jgi:hypothetical protein
VLAVALLSLVLPLTFGRQAHWPAWVWPPLAVCGGVGVAFARLERALVDRRVRPLLDVRLLDLPGVGAGVPAVLLIMACYSGFLITLTLFLQGEPLAFSPLHASSRIRARGDHRRARRVCATHGAVCESRRGAGRRGRGGR